MSSKFHSTLSRRSFMRALGLIAAGVGAVGISAPIFKDLDDMMAQEGLDESVKRPWWVSRREIGNPTMDIDWDAIEPLDNRYQLWTGFGKAYAYTEAELAELNAQGAKNKEDGAKAKAPGFFTRDFALHAATADVYSSYGTKYKWVLDDAALYTGQPGLEKHSDTPENNSRMLRAAIIFLGGSSVGICEIGEHEKKLIFSRHSQGRYIHWKAEDPSYNAEEIVIPSDRRLYAVAVGTAMSKELFRHENTAYGSGFLRLAGSQDRYRRWELIQSGAQRFVSYLGYHCMGYPWFAHGVMPVGADAVLSGLAESGRSSNFFISPEHGTVQGYFSLITDLPLAPTQPIDAGIFRFCKTCRKCAESCPTAAISHDDEPSYDNLEDSSRFSYAKDKPVMCMGSGKKSYFWDAYACATTTITEAGNCANCMGTCTFNTNNGAGIHDLVKPVLSTTSLFNGFFYRADELYGFGLTTDEKKEKWWEKSYPVSGFDSTVQAFHGAYKKV